MPMPAGVGVAAGGGGFSPLDLSPTLWLDASDATTITEDPVGSGSVSQWDDKSGNGYNLTQGTGSAQPKTGTATINSLNVIEYDGADTQFLQNTSVPIDTGGPYTVFMVQEINASDTNTLPVGSKSTSAYGFVGTSGSSGTVLTANWGTPSLYVNGTEFTGTTRGDVWTAFTNSPAVVRQQDILASSSAFNGLRIGYAGAAFNLSQGSQVAEIIVVDSPTAQQISDTETYLADKWGITL